MLSLWQALSLIPHSHFKRRKHNLTEGQQGHTSEELVGWEMLMQPASENTSGRSTEGCISFRWQQHHEAVRASI